MLSMGVEFKGEFVARRLDSGKQGKDDIFDDHTLCDVLSVVLVPSSAREDFG